MHTWFHVLSDQQILKGIYPIVQWESNNDDGQPNLWFGFSNKFNAYLGPPDHLGLDVGTRVDMVGTIHDDLLSFDRKTTSNSIIFIFPFP